MSVVLAVIGEGQLADMVCSLLTASRRIVRQPDFEKGLPEQVSLALVVRDGWEPSFHQAAEAVFQQSETPWLRGFVAYGEGVIGPLVRPGTPGCSQCADLRRLMAGGDRKEMWELQQRLSAQGGVPNDAWASRSGLLQLAHQLAAEAERIVQGRPAQTESRILLLQLQTLRSTSHFFLPDPLCPVCGHLPDDSAEAARISLQPSFKINPNSYRCRPMEELKAVLARDYLDGRTGFLNGKMLDLVSPFADSSVNLPLFSGDEGCAGRTHSYADSELTAILEGLERYCGVSPRGKRTVVHDSYTRLQATALDPALVGAHAREQYERPDFPFQSFDPDKSIDWVWGYSFLQERPLLVPEKLAYYSAGCGHGFVYETSNGCALGGSVEEAIMYGILEAVERDSFLLTWYAQLPLPRIDIRSAEDRELQSMVERLRAVAGYELHLFNSTMEHGIPSVWVVASNTKDKGVNMICAAGAHPDPLRAVKSAVHEVAGMLMTFSEKFEANKAEYEPMLHDPYLVRQMEDHSMLYALPQAEDRLRFLLDPERSVQTFEEAFKPKAEFADLTDDLRAMLQAFREQQLDVIVVDQSTPETLRSGLHCVKVLIPGLLPMTFGHHLVRLTGLERMLRVPVQLGYAEEPLKPEQLNPHPHPFP